MTKTTKATKIKKTEVKILCQDYVPKNKKSLSFLVSYFLRKLVNSELVLKEIPPLLSYNSAFRSQS